MIHGRVTLPDVVAPPGLSGEPCTRPSKLGGSGPAGQTIGLTSFYMERDGCPSLPIMGEFHYSRFPHYDWDEEVAKIAAGGIDILSTYVFWIHHEEEEGRFDWSGDNDLRTFVRCCEQHGLQVVVRIGPFAHGECRNGGLPDWLYGQPFAVRSTDPRFLHFVRRLYREISTQLDGLLYKDGGPVIGVQLDNEYMHTGAPWEVTYRQGVEWLPNGDEGLVYMRALKDLAARTLDGTVPPHAAIKKMTDAQIVERLTEVRGIGPWTVEMLLIFRMGRPDVLPSTDYGVRKGFALTFQKLPKTRPLAAEDLPKPEVLLKRGKRWAPFRSVASWYLWRACDLVKDTASSSR